MIVFSIKQNLDNMQFLMFTGDKTFSVSNNVKLRQRTV